MNKLIALLVPGVGIWKELISIVIRSTNSLPQGKEAIYGGTLNPFSLALGF